MTTVTLILFPLLWLLLLAGIYYLKGYRLKNFEPKLLLLYVVFMAMLGPVGEVFVGTFYERAIGQPLWQYQVLPTHNGYTSLYAPVIWGISGALLYFIDEVVGVFKKRSKWFQAISKSFETILVEALLNVSFLVMSGTLIFYYLPADLLHITSLQTLPFYFILSVIIMKSMKRLKKDPVFFSQFFVLILIVTVYLTD